MKQILKYSLFRIIFTNSSIETKFQEKLFNKGAKVNKIAFLVNCLLVTLQIILILIQINKNKEKFYLLLFLVLSQIPLLITIGLLLLIASKKKHVYKICGILNYLVNSLSFNLIKRSLSYLYNLDSCINAYLYYCNFLSSIMWINYEIADYSFIFGANIIIVLLMKPISIFVDSWPEKYIWPPLLDDVYHLLMIGICFWKNKDSRYLFYYMNEMMEQNEWFKRIINSMNSGFIEVTNGKITFLNQAITELGIMLGIEDKKEPETSTKTMSTAQNTTIHNTNTNTNNNNNFNKKLLTFLLKRIDFIQLPHYDDNEELTICTPNSFFKEVFEKIKAMILNLDIQDKEKSIYLGRGNISESAINLNFEIYVRFYINDTGEHFEFLLTNVTRTKLVEEKNAELRIKSTFLSKIAHEFKNPLICLSEVVNQEYQSNDNKENSTLITSISNYLLILIKNIDCFTLMQCNEKESKLQLNISISVFDELLFFIKMIALYLLKKKSKNNCVTFDIINNYTKKHIETDEIKVKQLLLNLISNAIKFTNQGSITLIISEDDENHIKFIVKDTGIGIPESFQAKLFEIFAMSKNDNVNTYGADLGLSITKELAYSLGKGIEFISCEGKGSEFWFTVKNEMSDLDNKSVLSDITLNLNHNDLPVLEHSCLKNDMDISFPEKTVTIIIADDEELIRMSTTRILLKYANKYHINLNILEASDGLELIWIYLKENMKGNIINIIISDENMLYYSGHKASLEIMEMNQKKGFSNPKFFISSAYFYNKTETSSNINGYFHKPLNIEELITIFTL